MSKKHRRAQGEPVQIKKIDAELFKTREEKPRCFASTSHWENIMIWGNCPMCERSFSLPDPRLKY